MKSAISTLRIAVFVGVALGLAGCDHMSNHQQRTLSGAAIGAGAGALVGAAVGDPWAGAAVGGAAGGVIGATTH